MRGGADPGRTPPRPTREQLLSAAGRTVEPVVGPGLRVLFCGINPSLYTAWTGHHFARPGNRFWPALHGAGFTDRQLAPQEQQELLGLGLGVTNVVERATARADELSAEELRAGAARLAADVQRWRPDWLAVLGVTAYRQGFDRRRAVLGPQPDRVGGARVWVLPNPSGLNAHHTPTSLARLFAELHEAVEAGEQVEQREQGEQGERVERAGGRTAQRRDTGSGRGEPAQGGSRVAGRHTDVPATGAPAVLVVDVANVVGSRPDGWWRDRVGATHRLLDRVAAADLGEVVAVVEGRARDVGDVPGVRVVRADGSGDDEVVAQVAAQVAAEVVAGAGRAGGGCTVVTADRGLRDRLPAGTTVVGPGWLLDRLDRLDGAPGA